MNLKYPLIATFSLLLLGCDNTNYEKSLQNALSRQDNQALCYFLPNKQNLLPADIFFDKPTEILDLFVELKFLETSNIKANFIDKNNTIEIEGVRYKLTEEGKQYFIDNKGAFCFGSIIVDKINDTYNIKINYVYTVKNGKWIDYNYHYTNIPNWAKDKRLQQYYNHTISLNNEVLLDARATYYSSDGSFDTGIKKNKVITFKD
ncbi:hypothetical protein A9G35_04085 [Gilliamella sp. Choc5-1]|jgi:hypothetical protein|uniref:hypothetical protein n=1 Tax=Gilliamella sp. Choc5-1 TaxID=3120238 RepID=UPI00080ECA54|nr:hypothetical protein [Gilliamella apicola]OCG47174.1 hypothetical protein A9G35_04085 [Gilliamella apicola]